MEEDLKKTIEFHGHFCAGLAMGYRVAKYVKNHYKRSEDEELVAIVYNKSCSIDAIQYLLGCTFGKGNLIFKDYGKYVYVFYSRDHQKGIRISFKDILYEEMNKMKEKLKDISDEDEKKKLSDELKNKSIEMILNLPEDELLHIEEVDIPEPKKAKIYPSLKCEECGEYFMEIKGRLINGKVVCKECFEKLSNE
ncbi:FmdE family protein [Methanothermococcus okinawensis]|uniref:Formylmethanofuran dehydrogenase subunit E region n=1 Tax=Methanothermococcus okinawensis (strain DSM 14208 / JCM 11175 / IH1) TaxID=647113 RepID=F8AJQ1_METOI|nr:FmdE family protein [Methanothermococcus okinawensis]AEH07249.1 formylmethanofuran dehydrogenase subunit E region [Methanothermococcus okinawensis IH1]